mgnify:CR=1 FL=1
MKNKIRQKFEHDACFGVNTGRLTAGMLRTLLTENQQLWGVVDLLLADVDESGPYALDYVPHAYKEAVRVLRLRNKREQRAQHALRRAHV